jgi:hypothetical protein
MKNITHGQAWHLVRKDDDIDEGKEERKKHMNCSAVL